MHRPRLFADHVCGNLGADHPAPGEQPRYFPYRSSMYLAEFFQELDTDWRHDGSTRHRWGADVLDSMLAEPYDGPTHPPEIFCRPVDQLMSPSDATSGGPDRQNALEQLNQILVEEGFEAFFGDDRHYLLRHVGPNTLTVLEANPHRTFTAAEVKRRHELASFINRFAATMSTADIQKRPGRVGGRVQPRVPHHDGRPRRERHRDGETEQSQGFNDAAIQLAEQIEIAWTAEIVTTKDLLN